MRTSIITTHLRFGWAFFIFLSGALPVLATEGVAPINSGTVFPLFPPSNAGESILWDSQEATVVGKDRRDLHISYSGQNISNSSVYVKDIKIDCACLMIHLENRTIKSGERFELFFKYGVRDAGGKMSHVVKVIVKEGDHLKTYKLFLHVDVPVIYTLNERRHDWNLGSLESKESRLIIPKSTGIKLVSARIFGYTPGLFELSTVEGDLGDSVEYVFNVVPSFASSLSPKKGALGAVGLLLTDGKNEYKDLIQLINWPIPQPLDTNL